LVTISSRIQCYLTVLPKELTLNKEVSDFGVPKTLLDYLLTNCIVKEASINKTTKNKEITMVKRMLLVAALLMWAVTFIGCHTTEGFGEDVQWTGEKIQEAAE